MDIEAAWQKALKHTEIVRSRIQSLSTTSETSVPYVLLSESVINDGDTVVRKGRLVVSEPSLLIPPNNPQFDGFDFEQDHGVNDNSMINFLLLRGVRLPSMRYDNKTSSLEVYEGSLNNSIKYYHDIMKREENVKMGLITGPEDCWQFSLLIFIFSQIMRNAQQDIQKLLEKHNRENNNGR